MSERRRLAVRAYREPDEPAVLALWASAFGAHWSDPRDEIRWKLARQRDLFLVGELDGGVVATAMGGYDGHRGWLYKLAVATEHRRRGVGRRMVEELETRLRALGCRKLNLQIFGTNRGVVAFYERLGFRVEERISMGRRLG